MKYKVDLSDPLFAQPHGLRLPWDLQALGIPRRETMHIERDGIMLCVDCLFVAVNGDYSGIDEYYGRGESPGQGALRDGAKERAGEIDAGLARLGPHLCPSFDSETGDGIDEFSSRPCDCCGSCLAGSRHAFAILAE